MCGIAGIVHRGATAEAIQPTLDHMVATMVHRGPDAFGTKVSDGVGIGMRRLAIIDLPTGQQPMVSDDGGVWVVQNGEIYNHRELRRALDRAGYRFRTASDTEVLVHGWRHWGEGLLERLDGMFAFAVWEPDARRLVLVRDRFGIKPLHWAPIDGGVLFGSELRALGCLTADRRIDRVAWAQYLLYEHVPAPRTIWEGVHKLEAGSLLEVVDGEVRPQRRWWRLRFEPDRRGNYQDRVGELRDVLGSAVATEMESDVPVGVLLSGGVDSSAVAAAANRAAPGVLTFTQGVDDPSFDESSYGASVAAHLGTNRKVSTVSIADLEDLVTTVVGLLDEPLADSSIVPTYVLARSAAAHVKVVLGGDGGDEMWAGYPTHFAHRVAGFHRRLPRWIREGIVARAVGNLPTSFDNISLDFRLKRFVTGSDLSPELQNVQWLGGYTAEQVRGLVVPELADDLPDEVLFEPVLRTLPSLEGMEPMDRILALDAELYLQGILTKVDRASMACSLEVRVPLLNRAVVEVARQVPFEWKLRGRRGKAILRDAVAPDLPVGVLQRGKKGFNIPVAHWLRGPGAATLDAVARGLPDVVRPHVVQAMIGEHRRGERDNRKLLWPLVVDHVWAGR